MLLFKHALFRLLDVFGREEGKAHSSRDAGFRSAPRRVLWLRDDVTSGGPGLWNDKRVRARHRPAKHLHVDDDNVAVC